MAGCIPTILQESASVCCMAGIGDIPVAGCMACRRRLPPCVKYSACSASRRHAVLNSLHAALGGIGMQSLAELAADGWHHGCMQVSQDEEKLQKARLEVKRGLPLQDLSGNKGFPEDARMQSQVRRAKDTLQYW